MRLPYLPYRQKELPPHDLVMTNEFHKLTRHTSHKATGNSRFETEEFHPLSEKFPKIPVVYSA